ncbi:MAG: endonuclease [Bacteroidales bacterium]
MKKICLFLVSITWLLVGVLYAQEPLHYYDSAVNKVGYQLKTALFHIIATHVERTYANLWVDYGKTDADSTGSITDMYSSCPFIFKESQCTGTMSECGCYNREHSFPKSWFKEGKPMYTDLFHLYPVDGYANTRRNNNPYGEVSNPKWVSKNGGKLGPCTFSGYVGTAFEPIDEYKGDLARSYFYMVTCYEDRVGNWSSEMLDVSKPQVFSEWAVNLLLKWSKQDPVSPKEIKRNNVVYQIQGNRNPFIDHPCLVEKIWGGDLRPFTGKEDIDDPQDKGRLYIDYELIREGDNQILRSGSLPVGSH